MSKAFEDLKKDLLMDDSVRTEYDALELEYKLIKELIEFRNKENLTQEGLSKRIGIPKANISRFENNKHSPSIQTLVKIAAGLNKKIEFKLIDFK